MIPGILGTFSGKVMNICEPTPWMVCKEDIAHHLSAEMRWNGATSRPFSVAEHSIWVARFTRRLLPREAADRGALHAMLHDAPEAYLKDVPTPLKVLLGPVYSKLNDLVYEAILDHFDLTQPDALVAKAVSLSDAYSAWCEAKALLPQAIEDCTFKPPDALLRDVPMHTDIRGPSPPNLVEQAYLSYLNYLLRVCK